MKNLEKKNVNNKHNNVKRKKGFTLIEIIAVIIIIGILSIITVPAVSKYIVSSREKTYLSHEKSMKEAAASMTVECIDNNGKDCLIPDKGEKSFVYLSDLIEKGYLDRLKTSDGGEFCDTNLSYVEIKNTGKSNYEYSVCLYCGDYETDSDACVEYVDDGDKPVCGKITGENTSWSNTNKTIAVGCSDATSGCTKSEFSKTFTTSTKTGVVEITDRSGNVTECPVNVYIDKELPTCELEVTGGTLETSGWYSGDVKVKLKSYNDTGSGVLTYGIGTSISNRNYNKNTELSGFNMGTTTVIGYVKDYAGNEGVCSIDVRVGAPKPTFEVEYGYQIYPNKESYTLTNMTESGTVLKSTTTDPIISFTGLGNYKNVNRVVVYLNKAIEQTTTGQVFYSNGSHSETNSKKVLMVKGQTKIEFEIPKGTYQNIRIDLGDTSGLSYDIKKIELRVGDRSSLYTSKDVSVNIIPTNEVVKTTDFSFDNGSTWQSGSVKEYSTNITGTVKTKNLASLISNPVNISIGNIDKLNPKCTLKADGTMSTSEYYGTDVTISFSGTSDQNANSQYAQSNVRRYGIGSVTGNKTVIHTEDNTTGVTYTGYVEDNAGNVGTCSITIKKKANFTINYNNNNGTGCTTKNVVFNNAIGSLCTPTRTGYTFAGWYKEAALTNKVETTTVFKNDFTTLYAKWTANTYTVTFNANGGSVGTASKTVTYDGTYGTLSTASRAGYAFAGWYTAASGGTKVETTTKVQITANQTLYAHWTQCTAGTYAEAGATSCSACPSGYTSDAGATAQNKCYINVSAGKYIGTAGSSTQTSCAAGKYKAAHTVYYGSTSSCDGCPSGYTSAAGATAQNKCYISVSAGKYIGTANSATQTSCAAGKYKTAHTVYYGSTSSCDTCPSGYTSAAGATAQNKCYINVSAGKYIATANSATQTSCAAGKYKAAHTVYYGSTSSCSTCGAGTYSTGGAGSCSTCPSGYTSAAGATAQNKCYISVSAGKYIGTANSATQSTCAAGKYKAAHTVYYGSTSSCSTCGAGTYSTAGAGSCTTCPSGYTSAAGATAQNRCYINVSAGKYIGTANSSTQTNCAAGKYKAAHTVYYGSTSSCSTCGAGTYSTGGAGSCSTCPSGYTSAAGATAQNKCYSTLTATMNANGGSYSGSNATCNKYYGSTSCSVKFSTVSPTRTGYTFNGWSTSSTSSSGTGVGGTANISNNTTFYATWKANCPTGYTLQSNGKCTKTYAASVYYTCPSGGTLSGSTCTKTSTEAATLTYSGGCSWSKDGGHFSPSDNQSGCIHEADLPACSASNKGATQKVYDCGVGKVSCKSSTSSSYSCSTSCSSDLKRYTYKLYTCNCSGTTYYSCPSGGTVSGSNCIKTSTYTATTNYSCNSGDTLSGSTCTSVVTPS